jgi:D-beta-D-heptose 7-phosphate kinase/D-beta-D-heptose 1-phosphate adenosyltransferase
LLEAAFRAIKKAGELIDMSKHSGEHPRMARAQDVPVCVDPKPAHPLALRGTAVLTPNRKETFELAGLTDDGATGDPLTDAPLLRAVARIQERHDPALLLVTLSEAGLLLVERNRPPQHIPTFARQVYDVTGAGDTVIATFVLARAAGASPLEAATIANYAAGIVVGKTGTAAATPVELFSWVGQLSG